MKALKEGSQNARILGYLAHGKTLTPISALRLFDCWALSSRVSELRRRGHKIKRQMVDLSSGKSVAQYSLKRAV
jgi:hypothetical protein